jgi:hypothetical protein
VRNRRAWLRWGAWLTGAAALLPVAIILDATPRAGHPAGPALLPSPLRRQDVGTERRELGYGPYVPTTARDATMLGEAQWRWPARQLEVPAGVRLIASSVQQRVGTAVYPNFGTIELDWDATDPAIRLRLHPERAGAPALARELRLSELCGPWAVRPG